MARQLESELAKLSRTVRRRVALRELRSARSTHPRSLRAADRIALFWDHTGARVLRWVRRAGRR